MSGHTRLSWAAREACSHASIPLGQRQRTLTTFLNLRSTRTAPVERCPDASVLRSATSLTGSGKRVDGEARQIQRVTDRGHALEADSRAVDSHCAGAAYEASAARRDAHINGY